MGSWRGTFGASLGLAGHPLCADRHRPRDQIKREDATRKWRAKVADYREAWANGDPAFDHDGTHEKVVSFLFPEIADKVWTTPF